MIKTEGVCKTFQGTNNRGPLEVLKDISLTVEQKEVVCIIGPSGAGKSTYLRTLNRLET
ncbi:MAG: ATP-binding cassette domain-containing protein, partial [Treponema sp.]|nr:ATP-binding cassette domain-containing protein [Treponema sp.]